MPAYEEPPVLPGGSFFPNLLRCFLLWNVGAANSRPPNILYAKYWDFRRKYTMIALRPWHFVCNTPPEPFGPTPLTCAGGEPGG